MRLLASCLAIPPKYIYKSSLNNSLNSTQNWCTSKFVVSTQYELVKLLAHCRDCRFVENIRRYDSRTEAYHYNLSLSFKTRWYCRGLYLLSHANHNTLVAGSTDDGGEDSAGGVVSGEAGFAHAGAIVNNKSSNLVVTHFVGWVLNLKVSQVEEK